MKSWKSDRPEDSLGTTASRRSVIVAGGAAAAAMIAARTHRAAAQDAAASPSAVDWSGVDALLAATAPNASMLAAELVDGTVEPIHALDPDLVQPVGSSFKLWILAALGAMVEAGDASWDDIVEIEERHRSVPGGDLRFAAAGTPFTIRYLAERMIQKSDNTATDHVLAFVGRENAEAAMVAIGHHDPALNTPLLATREFAMLKFAATPEQQEEYLAASVEERRRLLDDVIGVMPFEALSDLDQSAPIEIDRIEWFANRNDLANTMAHLLAQSRVPGLLPVTEILSLETQLTFDAAIWPYVGFKGGSEMGVLSGTWLMESADGRHFVYTVGFSDPDAALDMGAAVAAMEAGRDLLGSYVQM